MLGRKDGSANEEIKISTSSKNLLIEIIINVKS